MLEKMKKRLLKITQNFLLKNIKKLKGMEEFILPLLELELMDILLLMNQILTSGIKK
jgi:hypothetical protein